MVTQKKQRIWFIDSLRGIALILMIIFHYVFDLYYFNIIEFNIHSTAWKLFNYTIGVSFIVLSGLSCSLMHYYTNSLFKIVLNIFKIGICALIITFITIFVVPSAPIYFGILHLITLSWILSIPLFSKSKKTYIPWGITIFIFIILSLYIPSLQVIIGKPPQNFSSLDYYPFFPWYIFFLIGVYLGYILLKKKNILFMNKMPSSKLNYIINHLGKQSLFIYLIHQPIILLFIYLFLI